MGVLDELFGGWRKERPTTVPDPRLERMQSVVDMLMQSRPLDLKGHFWRMKRVEEGRYELVIVVGKDKSPLVEKMTNAAYDEEYPASVQKWYGPAGSYNSTMARYGYGSPPERVIQPATPDNIAFTADKLYKRWQGIYGETVGTIKESARWGL